MKILTTLRNNWKKSVAGAGAAGYGINYLINRKRDQNLLQAYCYEALKYSKDKVRPEVPIKRVTVFLNPIANGERGKFVYDKTAAPLLNLSGLDVRLIRLDRNSDATEYMKAIEMGDTDMIVVAGGNATMNEVIKGLVDRPDSSEFLKRIPIGVLPIGETNVFARKWLSNDRVAKDRDELRLFADAAMSILKGETQPISLLRITLNRNEQKQQQDDLDTTAKKKKENAMAAYTLQKENKIYALSSFQCGFVTHVEANVDEYWMFGFKALRKRANQYFCERFLLRNPFQFEFAYKLKCTGCSKCLNKEELELELKNLVENTKTSNKSNGSWLGSLRNVFSRMAKPILTKEQIDRENRVKANLGAKIQKAGETNNDCNKIHATQLKQVQLVANINYPAQNEQEENLDLGGEGIETVIVKDPKFNYDDMFLADKKNLAEFEIKKMPNLGPDVDRNPAANLNRLALEIDGEIYRLDNHIDEDLSIRVEQVNQCIHLLKLDTQLASSIEPNYLPKIVHLTKRSLEEFFYGKKVETADKEECPPMLPFEKYYLKFWASNSSPQ